MSIERKEQFFRVVFKDEEAARELMAKTPEEVSKYMAEQGYSYSVDEIKTYGEELMAKIESYKLGELNEAELDDVAGGKGEFKAGVAVGMLIGVAFLGGW